MGYLLSCYRPPSQRMSQSDLFQIVYRPLEIEMCPSRESLKYRQRQD